MKRKKNPHADLEKETSWAGEGLVMVDGSLNIIALNKGAESILYDADPGRTEAPASLPQDLLSLLSRRTDQDSTFTYVNSRNQEYSCRSFVVKHRNDPTAQPSLILYLEQEMSVVNAVSQVGAEYRLTDREQEALIGVAMGLSSKEVAVRMHISPNTVKAFLRLIMVKMGATTRAGIVGRLIDQNGRSSSAHGGGR